MITAEILNLHEIEPFSFRWPKGIEDFEGRWAYQLRVQIRNEKRGVRQQE